MEQLPADIDEILECLAESAAAYGNRLKWNEEAMLKADLMKSRAYWQGFPPSLVRSRCLELGMSEDDARMIEEYVKRTQAGRRLVPHKSYRGHTFPHEGREPHREQVRSPKTSVEW